MVDCQRRTWGLPQGFVGNVQNVGSDEYVDSSAPTQNIALQQTGNVVNVVSTSLSTNP